MTKVSDALAKRIEALKEGFKDSKIEDVIAALAQAEQDSEAASEELKAVKEKSETDLKAVNDKAVADLKEAKEQSDAAIKEITDKALEAQKKANNEINELNTALAEFESGKKKAPAHIEVTVNKKVYLVLRGIESKGVKYTMKELAENVELLKELIKKGSGVVKPKDE